MSRWRRKIIDLRDVVEVTPVPIIADACIATRGLAGGRFIPLLILDTSRRPDIDDLIKIHRYSGAGDARSSWALPSRFSSGKLRLVLEMNAPGHCVIVLEFNTARQTGVIQQLVDSQGVYLQSGRVGDRLYSTLGEDRILVEIPSRQFRSEWDRLRKKVLVRLYRKRGLARGDAKVAADRFVAEWRKLTSQRLISEYEIPEDQR